MQSNNENSKEHDLFFFHFVCNYEILFTRKYPSSKRWVQKNVLLIQQNQASPWLPLLAWPPCSMDNHKIAVTESTPAKLARILTQTTNILSSYILVHVQMSCLPFYSIIQNLVTIFNSLLYLTTHEKKILFFFLKKIRFPIYSI